MKKIPHVSVIIPTWNRRELLSRAVHSALTQEGVSVEVLVCDDGSDDGSREMIAAWGDERVRLITGPRAGRPAIPRNRGIAAAQGEWLAFLDDDDEWLPGKLRRQLDNAVERGCLAVCSNALRHIPGKAPDLPYLPDMPEILTFTDLSRLNSVITSSTIVHRSLIPRVGGFPEQEKLRAVEDYALWLRVAAITTFAYLDIPLLIYRDAPTESIRNQGSSENLRQARVFCDWLLWAKARALSGHGLLAVKRFLFFRFPGVHTALRRVWRMIFR